MKDPAPYYPRKRTRIYKGEYRAEVGSFISKHFDRLRVELDIRGDVNYFGMSDEDAMSETFIFVCYSSQASTMTEIELLEYFKYKYKMLFFQTIRDAKSFKIVEGIDAERL